MVPTAIQKSRGLPLFLLRSRMALKRMKFTEDLLVRSVFDEIEYGKDGVAAGFVVAASSAEQARELAEKLHDTRHMRVLVISPVSDFREPGIVMIDARPSL